MNLAIKLAVLFNVPNQLNRPQSSSLLVQCTPQSSEEKPFNAILDLLNKYINLFIQIITILCINVFACVFN